MFPPMTMAASLEPSLEDAMPFHAFASPVVVSLYQLVPECSEIQTWPPSTTAASLSPELEEAMLVQSFELPTDVSPVQVPSGVAQFAPPNPGSQFVHVHEPTKPLTSPPLTQYKYPSLPSAVESGDP